MAAANVEHSNYTSESERAIYTDSSSISTGIASIADDSPRLIGRSSYWEYIIDLKSIKNRRPTPIVR